MYHTYLSGRGRENTFDGFCKPIQIVSNPNQDILHHGL